MNRIKLTSFTGNTTSRVLLTYPSGTTFIKTRTSGIDSISRLYDYWTIRTLVEWKREKKSWSGHYEIMNYEVFKFVVVSVPHVVEDDVLDSLVVDAEPIINRLTLKGRVAIQYTNQGDKLFISGVLKIQDITPSISLNADMTSINIFKHNDFANSGDVFSMSCGRTSLLNLPHCSRHSQWTLVPEDYEDRVWSSFRKWVNDLSEGIKSEPEFDLAIELLVDDERPWEDAIYKINADIKMFANQFGIDIKLNDW